MTQDLEIPCFRKDDGTEEAGVQFAALPYAGGSIECLLAMGIDQGGSARPEHFLASLEDMLAEGARWSRWRSQAQPTFARVILPRCRIQAPTINLKEILTALGISAAFDSSRADFSGMSPTARQTGLHISKVLHQTCVRLDESGTEAAAAAAVVMGDRGIPPQPQLTLRYDRPFLFAIRHVATGAPLFVGRVAEPGMH